MVLSGVKLHRLNHRLQVAEFFAELWSTLSDFGGYPIGQRSKITEIHKLTVDPKICRQIRAMEETVNSSECHLFRDSNIEIAETADTHKSRWLLAQFSESYPHSFDVGKMG